MISRGGQAVATAQFTKKAQVLRSFTVAPDGGLFARVDEVSGLRDDKNIVDLVCACGDFLKTKPGWAPWCAHVERVYRDGLDTEDGPEDFPSFINVTVKTHPGIIMTVHIESPQFTDQKYRKVYIHAPGHDVHEEDIGLITDSDGRWTLRSLIIDWLAEKSYGIRLGKIICKSDWHRGALPWELVKDTVNGGSKRPWDGYNSSNRVHLANLADILVTGKCRTCNSDDGVPDV